MTQSTAGEGWKHWPELVGPAVRTSGEGRRTTAHLNLTVTMQLMPVRVEARRIRDVIAIASRRQFPK